MVPGVAIAGGAVPPAATAADVVPPATTAGGAVPPAAAGWAMARWRQLSGATAAATAEGHPPTWWRGGVRRSGTAAAGAAAAAAGSRWKRGATVAGTVEAAKGRQPTGTEYRNREPRSTPRPLPLSPLAVAAVAVGPDGMTLLGCRAGKGRTKSQPGGVRRDRPSSSTPAKWRLGRRRVGAERRDESGRKRGVGEAAAATGVGEASCRGATEAGAAGQADPAATEPGRVPPARKGVAPTTGSTGNSRLCRDGRSAGQAGRPAQ